MRKMEHIIYFGAVIFTKPLDPEKMPGKTTD